MGGTGLAIAQSTPPVLLLSARSEHRAGARAKAQRYAQGRPLQIARSKQCRFSLFHSSLIHLIIT
jgi:hypothetical protein